MEQYRIFLYIILGILPSSVWLLYYLKKDLHPEPKKTILKIFIYGALVTIPVFFIQLGLSEVLRELQIIPFFQDFPMILEVIRWFLVIALTEEVLKYLVVKFAILESPVLDEPVDIMLYMVVAALGFAAMENILYLFSPIGHASMQTVVQTAFTISFIRFIGATFLHTLCSATLGYYIALASLRTHRRTSLVLEGIVFATILHGWYDFSIINLQGPLQSIVPLFIISGLAFFMLYDFNEIKKVKSICKI